MVELFYLYIYIYMCMKSFVVLFFFYHHSYPNIELIEE